MNIENISKKNIKVIAIDFFDTIVHRKCDAEEILYMWAKRMAVELRYIIDYEELYELRKNCEKRGKNLFGKEEISYSQLMNLIFTHLEKIGYSEMEFDEFCATSECIELEIEKEFILIDNEVENLIISLKQEGYRLIIISDFYCSEKMIHNILVKLNIENYFEKVYISSEIGKRKSTGNLYKYIIKKLNILPKEICMIGDNKKSDYQIPKELGMKSIHRKWNQKKLDINLKKIFEMYKKKSQNEDNIFQSYVFELFLFFDSLYKKLIRENVRQVLFCSREGQLLKKMFDSYQKEMIGREKIITKYFYVSRKSTLCPSLNELKIEKFNIIFRQYEYIKIYDFLKLIGINDDEIDTVLKEIRVDRETKIYRDSKILEYLKQNKFFQKIYEEKRKNQKIIFVQYIQELGIALKEKVVLVDIGWKGTIQDNIINILDGLYEVDGYYLGLIVNEYGADNLKNKHGILFYDYPYKSKQYKLLKRNFLFYEKIFVADHGSVSKYRIGKNNMVEPVISTDKSETAIYNFTKKYQEELCEFFVTILKMFRKIRYKQAELEKYVYKASLYRQCVIFPALWKLNKEIRIKNKENFGNENCKNNIPTIIAENKKEYFFVDYTYCILEKLHLNRFKFMAGIYCKFIYKIKNVVLNLRS